TPIITEYDIENITMVCGYGGGNTDTTMAYFFKQTLVVTFYFILLKHNSSLMVVSIKARVTPRPMLAIKVVNLFSNKCSGLSPFDTVDYFLGCLTSRPFIV